MSSDGYAGQRSWMEASDSGKSSGTESRAYNHAGKAWWGCHVPWLRSWGTVELRQEPSTVWVDMEFGGGPWNGGHGFGLDLGRLGAPHTSVLDLTFT